MIVPEALRPYLHGRERLVPGGRVLTMTAPPRILVSNDDGINALGIKTLERIARALSDDVWVVAPETNQSGAAHSLTLTRPLRVRQPWRSPLLGRRHANRLRSDRAAADHRRAAGRSGALRHQSRRQSRRGRHLFGYGCRRDGGHPVQGAGDRAEPGLRGPAHIRWPTAERFAPEVIERLLATPWAPDVLMNVNFPDLDAGRVAGRQGDDPRQAQDRRHTARAHDPRGEPYLWIGALREDSQPGEGTDLAAIAAGYVSVTPVHLDMTHVASLDELRRPLSLTGGPYFVASWRNSWRQQTPRSAIASPCLLRSGTSRYRRPTGDSDRGAPRVRGCCGAILVLAGLAGCTDLPAGSLERPRQLG